MKSLTVLTIALLFTVGCNSTTTPDINIQRCEETLQNYVKYRDAQSAANYRGVFTDNATFTIPALKIHLVSADEITQRQQQAIKRTKSMHMMTYMDIHRIKANQYSAKSYFILYQQPANQPNAPTTIFNGVYDDELVLKNSECLIQSRRVNVIKKTTW
ncbi:nuclear transport factor 2 family protein [Pseudoalteromonas piscicida]|uniref:nuclear transport factor 2 family protein n=1 Tax=Pseudoalteromonas piscicida TaxID=43662 RepID=UPI0030AAD2FC